MAARGKPAAGERMRGLLLVVNAGSSSVKFSVFEAVNDEALANRMQGEVDGIGVSPRLRVIDAQGRTLTDTPVRVEDADAAMLLTHAWVREHVGREAAFAAIAHRIVHGGQDYVEPVVIDDAVIARLEALVPLAPLHQPQQIAAIRTLARLAPGVPQVGCFDTAFHHDAPVLAQAFALPRELTAKGLRRYGFHGLSYEYIVSVLPDVAPECAQGRLVVAHLGNGASMCAIERGRSIATTMGLTALDGLPMGTRCGALDPGVVLYLLRHEGMDAMAIEHLLYERSGLLGVSAISSDMRSLLQSHEPGAAAAVDLFVYRIGRELGSLAAALRGVDAIVFTGGIGEHAAPIRARVCNDAAWLGVTLDEAANASGGPRISRAGARVSAWVIPTDENRIVAQHARRLLGRPFGDTSSRCRLSA
jgi:acetate kinase